MEIFRSQSFSPVRFPASVLPDAIKIADEIRNAFLEISAGNKKCKRENCPCKESKQKQAENLWVAQDTSQYREKLNVSAADHTKIKQRKETKQGEEGSGEKMQDSGKTGIEDIQDQAGTKAQADQPVIYPFL